MLGHADLKCWTGYIFHVYCEYRYVKYWSSLVGLFTGFKLGIGTTSALFQTVGTKLFQRELLNIAHIGFAMVFESSLKSNSEWHQGQ